jgi:hypothetical protein
VFEAYGWEPTLTDEAILEHLVALNAERATEERNGHIRWLRPDYQAPDRIEVQQAIAGIAETEIEASSSRYPQGVVIPTEQQPFPKNLKPTRRHPRPAPHPRRRMDIRTSHRPLQLKLLMMR